ncbi:SDR family oxidoreductase [Flavitalea flava]
MNLHRANVVVTGGSDGIGLGLAMRFQAAGANVLITGRDPGKLEKAAEAFPGMRTYVSNISDPLQREALAKYIRTTMPDLHVLVNNAGIQRRISLAEDNAPWAERQVEIDTLLSGPIHLNSLLVPQMLIHGQQSLIVNVTSGGAFIPQVFAPVYSACKAALHSYTMVLRHSLANTPINVVELIPPSVQTSLAGPGASQGAALEDFCNEVFPKLTKEGITEVGFGPTANITQELSGKPLDTVFKVSATRFQVITYASES